MAEDKMNPEALDARIMLALETAPRTEIPAGFAARVMRQLPPVPVALSPARYGDRAAVACLLVLLASMLVCAPRATGGAVFWIWLESIFCAQFGLLAVWLVARNAGYTFASFF